MAGAAIALVVAIGAFVRLGDPSDGPAEDDASGRAAVSVTEASTTTTEPVIATPQQLAAADPGGDYDGTTKQTACKAFSDRVCPVPPSLERNDREAGLIITCRDSRCAARAGFFNFPLQFDGTSYLGSTTWDGGTGCGDGNKTLTYTLTLTPSKASLEEDRWIVRRFTGELLARADGGGCTPGTATFEISLTRA